jgi:hypothetical protein
MDDFRQFMKEPANNCETNQATSEVESYLFDGVDGARSRFGPAVKLRFTALARDDDEYLIAVQGSYTLIKDGKRTPGKAGEEYFIQRGVLHSAEVLEETGTIRAFGGYPADRQQE